MLFNGGGCAQSDNRQLLKFTCEDFSGGPPVNEGEEVYIEVTDIKGLGITYFSGVVAVGDTLQLNQDNQLFEADMFALISTPDQSTLLEKVQFHTSCSSNLELKNRFGALQLVEFINNKQGTVSCFTDFSFALDISLPITAIGEDVTITSLTAMTNFAGLIDLTDQVVGQPPIGPGGSLVVTLEGTIDASERMRYTIIYNIEGVRVSDGSICTGMEMVSFEAGRDPTVQAPTAPIPVPPPPSPLPPRSPPVASPVAKSSSSPSPSPAPGPTGPAPTTGSTGPPPTAPAAPVAKSSASPSPSPAPGPTGPAPTTLPPPTPTTGSTGPPPTAPTGPSSPTTKGGKGGKGDNKGTNKGTNKRRRVY